MKVKINNKGKKKTYNVVESWEEVTLEKFMELNMGKAKSKSTIIVHGGPGTGKSGLNALSGESSMIL